MKLVTLIIRPSRLDDIHNALHQANIHGLTITEVKGSVRKPHTELYRGAEYLVDYVSKVKLEIAIDDSRLDEVIEVLTKTVRKETGQTTDGKVFIYELTEVIRLHSGQTGSDAL
uniref:Nitrogen regulatory protein P-II family n=1 Tax=Candidatus Kentrum sp. FW TaxID=2126338 RepID=A0A450SM30_9GAMM|nr:MAG: nitrogen regulatory protein P-II family [Candidatus Kentron sp. FW]